MARGVWGRWAAAVFAAFCLGAITCAAYAQSEDVDALNQRVIEQYEAGKFAEATATAQRLLSIREKTLGPDHVETAYALNQLAWAIEGQGGYKEAEPLLERALFIREKVLGAEHEYTIFSLDRLASNRCNQGQFAQAEPLFRRALAAREQALGPDHIDTAYALNQVAWAVEGQGRYAEVEPLLRRALSIREKLLGPEHPNTAFSLTHLGTNLASQGHYAEAETQVRRALAIDEKNLGSDHLDVARDLIYLADLLRAQGRYSEAEPLFKRSLVTRERTFGPDHVLVAAGLNGLAQLYFVQGRYRAAEPPFERALAIREKVLDAAHPEIAASVNNLALLYYAQGRYGEAEPLLKRALAILEKALGPNHPHVATALNNLAELYGTQGRFADAEPLTRRALAIRENVLGSDHIDVATSLNNLAGLYWAQGRYVDTEPLFKRALLIMEKTLGPEHPNVATALNNLSQIYDAQGRYAEAEPLLKRALAIREKTLGADHPDVAVALSNLGLLYNSQDRTSEAEPLCVRALAIFEKTLGSDHENVATVLSNLAGIRLAQNEWPQAADYWRRATSVIERRAKRGLAPAGLSGRGKSEGERNEWFFRGLVKVTHRLSAGRPNESKPAQEMFEKAQWAHGSEAGHSLAQMAARTVKSSGPLAVLVRERQDLTGEWEAKDKLLVAAKSQTPESRNAGAEVVLAGRLAAIDARLGDIDARLATDFPEYTALSNPRPLSVSEVQAQLRPGEALVLFLDTNDRFKPLPQETFLWVVTKTEMRWVNSDLGSWALQEHVWVLRCGLDRDGEWQWSNEKKRWMARKSACASLRPQGLKENEPLPFNLAKAHALYQGLFGEVEDLIRGKHLLLVPSGALTSLPFQVLVTKPSPDGDLASAAWLIRDHALTVLPSVASLGALRRNAKPSAAPAPFIGFGNPVLTGSPECSKVFVPDKCPEEKTAVAAEGAFSRVAVTLAALTSYFRNGEANVAELKTLCPLPDTAHELTCVAKGLGADGKSLVLGKAMTETAVKTLPLDHYRIVHFATHGLLAGETEEFVKTHAEPALVFSPPDTATEEDDGLLTASEVAGLKLDADWVVMSACNTASGAEPGAEPLSGLARAFFYAGARALLVSHWPVNSYAATMLTSRTFAEMKRDPSIGRSKAFHRAMLALMSDKDRPWAAHPSVWAPFVVVGEGGASR